MSVEEVLRPEGTRELPPAAQDELLNALSDLLTAARAMKASQAEWEKRSSEVEQLMVKHGLASPRSRQYVRDRKQGAGDGPARHGPIHGPRARIGPGGIQGD